MLADLLEVLEDFELFDEIETTHFSLQVLVVVEGPSASFLRPKETDLGFLSLGLIIFVELIILGNELAHIYQKLPIFAL